MVVLSSSWRHDPDWKKTMQENGLDTDKFIGRTPSSDNGFRGDEIEQWLTDNADRDVESYVIVDDDSDFTPWQIKNHFVKTTWEEGLTPEKAGEMVEKLLKD